MYLSLYLLISFKYYWLKYLFDYMKVKSESHSVMSDSLQPHGLVHGILQARILEWVACPFFRGSSDPGVKPGSTALQVDSLPTTLVQ